MAGLSSSNAVANRNTRVASYALERLIGDDRGDDRRPGV
jgi:hypothetical protein